MRFQNIINLLIFFQFVTIYAAYLFDAVKLYASALRYLLQQEKVLNDKVILDVASNGTKIIETIIKINGTYKSKFFLSTICRFIRVHTII